MYPQTLGVFTPSKTGKRGLGKTRKAERQQAYWYVRRLSDEEFEVQPLNANHLPSGVKRVLSKSKFLRNYSPVPDYYETHTLPAMRSLNKKIELGEAYFKEGLLSEAEHEFLKATMVDEENAQANLGLGTVYSEQQKFSKVRKVLKTLSNSDVAFQEVLRQQFNTFGISLRKQGLHKEAINFYTKALEFNPNDEHLLFNLARALFEKGDTLECLRTLETALKINPYFEEAIKLYDYANAHG